LRQNVARILKHGRRTHLLENLLLRHQLQVALLGQHRHRPAGLQSFNGQYPAEKQSDAE
jgi:hypothetical protein